jgi:hypothetical protein
MKTGPALCHGSKIPRGGGWVNPASIRPGLSDGGSMEIPAAEADAALKGDRDAKYDPSSAN